MHRSRRILICNYEYPPLGGGGGTCSKFLARELVKRGHSVEIITSAFANLKREVRGRRFLLRRIPALRKRADQSNPKEMISYVASAVPRLLLKGGPSPDVVLSFHSIPSGLAAFPYSLIRRVPHIVLFRGGDVPGWLPGELDTMHRRTLWLNRLIVYQAAAALANSDGLRDLAQPSFPGKKIGVLYNGVDLSMFAPPVESRAMRKTPPRMLFVGRITSQKGLDVLLDAVARPGVRSLPWTLTIAGDGPLLDTIKAQAVKLRIADRVEFLGWQTREAIAQLYKESDLLVFPSRYEGMPNVVLEATSSGLPVIGTRIAGTEQIVEEGRTGFLIGVDDEADLANRIERLLKDNALRLSFGEEARRVAVAKWSWAGRAAELEDHIDRVIERWNG